MYKSETDNIMIKNDMLHTWFWGGESTTGTSVGFASIVSISVG
jgi:hypothetical protein